MVYALARLRSYVIPTVVSPYSVTICPPRERSTPTLIMLVYMKLFRVHDHCSYAVTLSSCHVVFAWVVTGGPTAVTIRVATAMGESLRKTGDVVCRDRIITTTILYRIIKGGHARGLMSNASPTFR